MNVDTTHHRSPLRFPRRLLRLTAMASLLGAGAALQAAALSYPVAKQSAASDTYFGVTYKDPFRGLENLKDPETEAWFRAEAALTNQVLGAIPASEALAKEWLALDRLRPERYGDIVVQGGRTFYRKTLGTENVGKLYYREGWGGEEHLLFDPGAYKPGVQTTVNSFLVSNHGKLVALGLTAGGAEFSEIRILEVDTGKLSAESYYPSYGPLSWTPDDKALLYDGSNITDIKSLEIELNRQTRLHVIGTAMEQDKVLFSGESYPELGIVPKEFPQAGFDDYAPGLIVASLQTVQNEQQVFVAEAKGVGREHLAWRPLCKREDNLIQGLVFVGDHVYAVTHTGAPHRKLVRTSVAKPDWQHAEIVLPEASDSITGLTRSQHYLYVSYSDGISMRVVQLDLASGKAHELKLPASGTVALSCPDTSSDRCILTITSWTQPAQRYDFDVTTETYRKSVFNSEVVFPGFDRLVSDEVEVKGHDGTLIPLSIIHEKNLKLDGSAPCILEGYGAYGMSYEPAFSVRHSVALHGVVVAYAHVRGGGEKGEDWYKAGKKTTKPNTWKDFISCAEYLIAKGYTSSSKLGGTGTSAGGILITRAITERPDLFAAAICNVGCANAMRMEFSSNGPVNIPEFGTVADETECKALYEMDGVQHVRAGVSYPAVLGVGGWNDPRVSVWEPGKFVASLQALNPEGKPALMLINFDNGHFTEEKLVTFRNFAQQYAFLLWQAGHPEFQPSSAGTDKK